MEIPVSFSEGLSLSASASANLVGMKYLFKPISVDATKQGRATCAENGEVKIQLPKISVGQSSSEGGDSASKGRQFEHFRGVLRADMQHEYVLIVNSTDNSAQLCKLDSFVANIRHERDEGIFSSKLVTQPPLPPPTMPKAPATTPKSSKRKRAAEETRSDVETANRSELDLTKPKKRLAIAAVRKLLCL